MANKKQNLYFLKDGTIVPGPSEVLEKRFGKVPKGVPAVANGIRIGEIAHQRVELRLLFRFMDTPINIEPLTDDEAINALVAWKKWVAQTPFEFVDIGSDENGPLAPIEMRVVSEKFRHGGRIDAFLKIDGKNVLVDWKTISTEKSYKSLRMRYAMSLAAYRNALREMGHTVDAVAACKLNKRTGEFQFEYFDEEDLRFAWRKFKCDLEYYWLLKQEKTARKMRKELAA